MINNIPEISVVIPLYNKGPHIARALNSVLTQTFQDFEVIVVNDGSTDDGAEIVRGFEDSRIRLIQQDNQGVSAARNRGIEAARGELIAFLDADDEWLPEHLQSLLRLRDNNPKAGAYATAYLLKSDPEIHVALFSDEIPQKPWEGLLSSYFKAAAFGDPPISSSTVAIPKNILKEMDGFNNEAWWGEDTDLWGRIALKYPIAFSWDGMGIYHTEASNRACKKVEPMRENIFIATALDSLNEGNVSPEIRQDLLEYIASKQIQTACKNLQAGRPDLARRNLMNCYTHYFWKTKYWALFWTYIPRGIYISLRSLKSRIKGKSD